MTDCDSASLWVGHVGHVVDVRVLAGFPLINLVSVKVFGPSFVFFIN